MFGHFCLYCDRTDQTWQEAEWEIEWGGIGKGLPSQDSNTGYPKRNGDVCRRAAHKAIGIDKSTYF